MKNNQLVLPISTAILIPENDSVRPFSDICEELDYRKLYDSYSTLERNPLKNSKHVSKKK